MNIFGIRFTFKISSQKIKRFPKPRWRVFANGLSRHYESSDRRFKKGGNEFPFGKDSILVWRGEGGEKNRDVPLWPCRVTVINVGWWNCSIFSDCLFVCLLLLRTFGVSQDAGRTPSPLRLRTMSLSLTFYRFSRANRAIFQSSGARDLTGLFKRCWECSILDDLRLSEVLAKEHATSFRTYSYFLFKL